MLVLSLLSYKIRPENTTIAMQEADYHKAEKVVSDKYSPLIYAPNRKEGEKAG